MLVTTLDHPLPLSFLLLIQVEHMEAEIAQKREELHKLQAEQEALRSHQMALESTMSNQDQLLAQLLQVCWQVLTVSVSASLHSHVSVSAADSLWHA